MNEVGRVLTGNATGLSAKPIVTLTGDDVGKQIGYVKAKNSSGILTDIMTPDGIFHQFRNGEYVKSSSRLIGLHTNISALASGDVVIVNGDGGIGGSMLYFGDTTLSIQSNSEEQRTITRTYGEMISVPGDLTLNLDNIRVDGGTITNYRAIYATGSVTITGSGNEFSGNRDNGSGGAIYAEGNVMLSGTNTFTHNSSHSDGGAIYAGENVFFSGKDSKATFSGNTADGTNNDIFSVAGVYIKDGGTYSFGGGILADGDEDEDGDLVLGEDGQDGSPNITFGSGSVTKVNVLSMTETNLTLNLNTGNKVTSVGDTTYGTGATQFRVNGVAVSDTSSKLHFIVNNSSVGPEEVYLGAVGNFHADTFLAAVTAQVESGNLFVNITQDDEGIWLTTEFRNNVVRSDSTGGFQNQDDLFNNAFSDGTGNPFTTGDVITLTDDADADAVVDVPTAVTAFTVQSNSVSDVRTITSTNDNRFFNVGGQSGNDARQREIPERQRFHSGSGRREPYVDRCGKWYPIQWHDRLRGRPHTCGK